jgi:hypothetical protein
MIDWICKRCGMLYCSATRMHAYSCICGWPLTEWPR